MRQNPRRVIALFIKMCARALLSTVVADMSPSRHSLQDKTLDVDC